MTEERTTSVTEGAGVIDTASGLQAGLADTEGRARCWMPY